MSDGVGVVGVSFFFLVSDGMGVSFFFSSSFFCVCVRWGGSKFCLVSDRVGLRFFGVRWGGSKVFGVRWSGNEFLGCQMEWE